MRHSAYFDASYKDGNTVVSYYIVDDNEIMLHKYSYFVSDNNLLYRERGIEELAMLELLRELNRLNIDNVIVRGDSQSLFSILEGNATSKDKNVSKIIFLIQSLLSQFKNCVLEWIPRSMNMQADLMCRKTMGLIQKNDGMLQKRRVQNIAKDYVSNLLRAKRDKFEESELKMYLIEIQEAKNLDSINTRLNSHIEQSAREKRTPKYKNLEDVALEMIEFVLSQTKNRPNKLIRLNSFLDEIHSL